MRACAIKPETFVTEFLNMVGSSRDRVKYFRLGLLDMLDRIPILDIIFKIGSGVSSSLCHGGTPYNPRRLTRRCTLGRSSRARRCACKLHEAIVAEEEKRGKLAFNSPASLHPDALASTPRALDGFCFELRGLLDFELGEVGLASELNAAGAPPFRLGEVASAPRTNSPAPALSARCRLPRFREQCC